MGAQSFQYKRPRPKRFDLPRRGKKGDTAGVAQAVIDRKVPAEAQRFCKILDAWESLVGSRMAQRSCPALLRKKLLFVDLQDRQWAHDMRYMQSTILGRIQGLLGPDQVLAMRCRVQPRGAFVSHAQRIHRTQSRRLAWREMCWPAPQSATLASKAPQDTKQVLDAMEHPGLRKQALALRQALSSEGPSGQRSSGRLPRET